MKHFHKVGDPGSDPEARNAAFFIVDFDICLF
jgi:hypothetical protein